MKSLALAAFLPALFGSAQAALPASVGDPNQPWISLSPDLQFQAGKAKNPANAARLAAAQSRFLKQNTEYVQESPFADSYETYYSPYAQSWRLLGFSVDCSSLEEGAEEDRALEENSGCIRMGLWAAYADLGYEGTGLGEYAMYDPKAGEWDTSGCDLDSGDDESRCVQMDCHLEGTEFELLGIFKEPEVIEEWFEQMFKHSGYCLWTEDEYEFMDGNRESWPDGCSESSISGLYYAIKPIEDGGMGIGAYTDYLCTQESSEEVDVEELTDGSFDQDFLDTWNAALSVYTICQSCVAYTPAWMSNYGGSDDGQGRRLDEDDGGEDGDFDCSDDAGYTNVNQCMKFNTHTTMYPITDYDIKEASLQGGLTHIPDQIGSAMTEQARAAQAPSAENFSAPTSFWLGLGYLSVAVIVLFAQTRPQSNKGSLHEHLMK
jgi:hypothetical protein